MNEIEIVNLLQNVARQIAPIDTGNLRMAINTTYAGNGTFITTLNATRADYGIYLDNGSRTKKHQGFFTERTFNAQVSAINTYLSGNIEPLGELMQSGLYEYDNPALDEAYLNSLSRYKGE